MSIGERIKKRREELGMSQLELAKRVGVTQGSIGNYETGVSNPTFFTKLLKCSKLILHILKS